MSSENPENVIEIRVNEIAQLFHTHRRMGEGIAAQPLVYNYRPLSR